MPHITYIAYIHITNIAHTMRAYTHATYIHDPKSLCSQQELPCSQQFLNNYLHLDSKTMQFSISTTQPTQTALDKYPQISQRLSQAVVQLCKILCKTR